MLKRPMPRKNRYKGKIQVHLFTYNEEEQEIQQARKYHYAKEK